MSFWSRNKSKKESTSSADRPPNPTIVTSFSATQGVPSPVLNGSQTTSPASGAQGQLPFSQRSANGASPGSPPDSPSTIVGVRASTAGQPFPWSLKKFRNANPFPRFGHAANVAAGKEGEIYVFGGLVKDKRRNDLYVIDSGIRSEDRW